MNAMLHLPNKLLDQLPSSLVSLRLLEGVKTNGASVSGFMHEGERVTVIVLKGKKFSSSVLRLIDQHIFPKGNWEGKGQEKLTTHRTALKARRAALASNSAFKSQVSSLSPAA